MNESKFHTHATSPGFTLLRHIVFCGIVFMSATVAHKLCAPCYSVIFRMEVLSKLLQIRHHVCLMLHKVNTLYYLNKCNNPTRTIISMWNTNSKFANLRCPHSYTTPCIFYSLDRLTSLPFGDREVGNDNKPSLHWLHRYYRTDYIKQVAERGRAPPPRHFLGGSSKFLAFLPTTKYHKHSHVKMISA